MSGLILLKYQVSSQLVKSFHVLANGFNPNNGAVNHRLDSPSTGYEYLLQGNTTINIFGGKNLFLMYYLSFKENIYLQKITALLN